MFPEIDIDNTQSEETTRVGKSFLFDFNKGDFVTVDGRLISVSGVEALKIWINKVFKTEKYKFKIYDTGSEEQYGITLLDFITKGYPQAFVEIELKREITEALLEHPEIISVESFVFTRSKRQLECSFTVNTIYGDQVHGEVII